MPDTRGTPWGRGLLIVALVTAGGGNLVFHLAAVRSVDPVAFGDFGVLIALTAVASLPLASVEVAFGSAIARASERGPVGADAVVARFWRLVTVPGMGLSAMVAGVAVGLLDVGPDQAVLLATFLLAAVHMTLGRALLVGGRHWTAASIAVLCPPAGRFVALLVLIGSGHADSAAALMGATVAGESAGAALAMQLARSRYQAEGPDVDVSGAELAVAFGSLGPVAVLAGADVMMARLALPAAEVGRLAAAANVARAGLYLPQAVAFSTVPDLSVGSARRAGTLLGRAVVVLTGLVGLAAVGLLVVGDPAAGLLLGDPTLGGLLAPLLIVAAGGGLTHLVVTAMLARRTRLSLYPLTLLPLLGIATVLETTPQVMAAAAAITVSAAIVGLQLFAVHQRAADRLFHDLPADPAALAGRSLSVVVPAYRPGPRLESHLRELTTDLDRTRLSAWEVLVVDDGCPAGTADRVTALDLPGVRLLTYEENRGKGYAVRLGISQTSGQIVGFLDADGDIPAQLAADLAGRVADGRGEVVIGDKTHPQSTAGRSRLRRCATFCWGMLVQVLFGLEIADTQVGVKAFDGPLARRCAAEAREDGFAFDLEMLTLAAAAGGRIVSAPVRISVESGRSSITPARIAEMVAAAVRIRQRGVRPGDAVPARGASPSDRAAPESALVGV